MSGAGRAIVRDCIERHGALQLLQTTSEREEEVRREGRRRWLPGFAPFALFVALVPRVATWSFARRRATQERAGRAGRTRAQASSSPSTFSTCCRASCPSSSAHGALGTGWLGQPLRRLARSDAQAPPAGCSSDRTVRGAFGYCECLRLLARPASSPALLEHDTESLSSEKREQGGLERAALFVVLVPLAPRVPLVPVGPLVRHAPLAHVALGSLLSLQSRQDRAQESEFRPPPAGPSQAERAEEAPVSLEHLLLFPVPPKRAFSNSTASFPRVREERLRAGEQAPPPHHLFAISTRWRTVLSFARSPSLLSFSRLVYFQPSLQCAATGPSRRRAESASPKRTRIEEEA